MLSILFLVWFSVLDSDLLARDSSRALSAQTAPHDSIPPRAAPRDTVRSSHRLELRGVLAVAGEGRGEVVEPSGVASDAFGRIWIADAHLHRVQRLDREGRWLGESGTLGSGPAELRRPGSVVPFGASHVAVLDQENRRVVAYDLFGRIQGVAVDLAEPALEADVGRVDPTGLAGDRGGSLFVADPARERVLVFDASRRFARALGGYGARPGQMSGLSGIAAGPQGELVVAERGNARVQRLDAGGRPAGTWPLPVDRGKSGTLAIAVDATGRVAVADESGGALLVFDRAGRMLARLGDLGGLRAVAFAADGTLLVAEARPARVRRFALVADPGN